MKRDAETVEHHLKSRYPWHTWLQSGIDDLKGAGYEKLSDLEQLSFADLGRYLSPLLCMALRDYVKGGHSDPVGFECTGTMTLECTEQNVTLLRENVIPELPDQFSPMFPLKMEEEINVEPAEQEHEENDELSRLADACADLPLAPEPPGPLTCKMFNFTTPKSQKALENIWCKMNGLRILERPSYVAVRRKVMALWNAGARAVLLLGVPGIGKTGFIIIMLLTLMKLRKAVVYQNKGGALYFFEPEHAKKTARIGQDYRCFRLKADDILLDPELYYLVDGKLPKVPVFGCKVLLAATTKLTNFQEFEKDGRCKKVFLPVWSAAEIALAWQHIFDPRLPDFAYLEQVVLARRQAAAADEQQLSPGADEQQLSPGADEQQLSMSVQTDEAWLDARRSLTLEVVTRRYSEWGGSARFVLEQPDVDLMSIVSGLSSIQQTVDAVGKQIADGKHPSHKIVHQRVKPGHDGYEYMFASPFLVEVSRRKLKASTSEALRLFLSFKGLGAHGVNGCKGYIFQHEFKELAIGNLSFKVREVHQDINAVSEDVDERFSFGHVHEVAKLDELVLPVPANSIIWPASKTEQTIDAIRIRSTPGELPILEVYQLTLSCQRHAHGLKYGAMLKLMQTLQFPPSRTRVYIVTTSELYPDAGYQNWRRSRNLVVRDHGILQKLVGISQYALDSGI